ncbi:MobC family plasmid mobilization relaxosome protein [Propionibacterium sp.]|uniref:MobC family plasmid mobilization relaxosome protein n=1 Tax=Propionibacterium sp. TaxID=1977903 RepID=UPI0039ED2EDC
METEQPEESEPVRRPARRRRVEGGRQHRHVVRVTPEEEGQLYALALQYRVSVPKLLVDAALAGGSTAAASNATVRHEVAAQMFATHRLLAGIANNVNQMAKATNATGDVRAEMVATLRKVREVADRIDGFVDELIGAAS